MGKLVVSMALPNEHADQTVFFPWLGHGTRFGMRGMQLAGHWIRVIGMKQTGNHSCDLNP